jgi:hypothetical protein
MVPIADHAEPLELGALHVDPVRGEIPALLAELDDRHLVLRLLLGSVFLLDLPFDRQAVTVPARHVDRVLAEHVLGAVHHVLQDLVERGAEMDVAVGVRRPVMQYEFGPASGDSALGTPEIDRGPAREERGLALRQIAAHREVGLWQKDGRSVVGGHGIHGVRKARPGAGATMGCGVSPVLSRGPGG